jgi:hypothetical protein
MRRAAWLLLLAGAAAHAATFTIMNMDATGVGLNDPTPFTSVGGNMATTLGQARLNVLQEAGRIWGAQLSSTVPIVVEASFTSLTCSANTGTLGSAGAHSYFTVGASPYLVPAALADALNGVNNGGVDDIFAKFNSDVRSGNSACLNGTGFYLGLDHASGAGIDLLAVVMHEFGHGLGFVSLVDKNGNGVGTNGTQLSAFDQYVYSESLGKFWPAMTATERVTSMTDNGKLVFNSPNINGVLSQLTGGLSNPGGHLRLYAPTTFSDGSTASHWDTPAQWSVGGVTRSLLMEPFITSNPLGVSDFTGCVLKDMGWLGTRCPDSAGVPPNQPPVANAQTVGTAAGVAVSITLSGSDPEGAVLSYAIVSSPAHGALSGTAPNLSYTPTTGYSGADSFTFRVNDGQLNSVDATVTINISPPPSVNASSSGGGGGGGAMNSLGLGLLFLLLLATRHASLRCMMLRNIGARSSLRR